jgi:hypothetical protein
MKLHLKAVTLGLKRSPVQAAQHVAANRLEAAGGIGEWQSGQCANKFLRTNTQKELVLRPI